MFDHDDYELHEAQKHACRMAKERADKLAEALEEIRSLSSINSAMNPDPFALTVLLADIHHIADAALAKENGDA